MKTFILIRILSAAAVFIFLISLPVQAKEVKVNFIDVGIIDMAAFKLNGEGKIKISGKGALLRGYRDRRGNGLHNDLNVYGWIIKSDTRDVVWHLTQNINSGSKKMNGIFSFEEEKNLAQGEYEVYYTAMYNYGRNFFTNNNWLKNIFAGNFNNYDRNDLIGLGMSVSSSSPSFTETNVEGAADRFNGKAIINLIRNGDKQDIKKGFTLKNSTRLKIYALGEAEDEASYDYAWIYDVKKNKRVWNLNYNNAKHAGGADKNIMFNGEVTLPEGSYLVNYTTDDSHSFEEWNSLPPDDPQFWGVTIWASTENDLKNISEFKQDDIVKPLVELTKVGDNESVSQGFSLSKDTKLRVLCLGEGVGDEDMADYGWIIDADSRKIVWKMEEDRSEHAGGADKNRMIDEEITLRKGNYIAFYSTDDSHSYFDWNDAEPYDKSRWGITIWTVNESDKQGISLFNEKDFKSKNVAGEIVRVRDNDFESREFTLDKETKIRIYAIGEGVRSSMADYGWIEEDATGKTVWEMIYRKTDHAGGASKNRMINEVITLPKGKYRIYYETDGSHSYRDWNSAPPDDQERYGITLTYEK
ncbi:MAG: hypothetical protein R6W90_10835 [Ignavibacteriaceae bacterium]